MVVGHVRVNVLFPSCVNLMVPLHHLRWSPSPFRGGIARRILVSYPKAMFRRLCLFLLTLCLALPAAAMPMHCAPVAVHGAGHATHHGKSDAPVQQVAKHACIGCIAPYTTVASPPVAALVTPPRQTPLEDLLLARLTAGPDTPPPRA